MVDVYVYASELCQTSGFFLIRSGWVSVGLPLLKGKVRGRGLEGREKRLGSFKLNHWCRGVCQVAEMNMVYRVSTLAVSDQTSSFKCQSMLVN